MKNTMKRTGADLERYYAERRAADVKAAAERMTDIPDGEVESNERAAHIIMSVLRDVKEQIESGAIEGFIKDKTADAICGTLDIITEVYECRDEKYDIYDRDFEDGRAVDDLAGHIAHRIEMMSRDI
ncbi:MAG: hypothetical protein J5994_10665 [Ruminococcus sp.]|nr:hypothetical protein [Ruminococcus sp.]